MLEKLLEKLIKNKWWALKSLPLSKKVIAKCDSDYGEITIYISVENVKCIVEAYNVPTFTKTFSHEEILSNLMSMNLL